MVLGHKLTQNEATKRIQGLLAETKEKFKEKITSIEESWDGSVGTFTITAMGYTISGKLTVQESQVELDGNLPGLAALYANEMKYIIRERAEALLV